MEGPSCRVLMRDGVDIMDDIATFLKGNRADSEEVITDTEVDKQCSSY